MAPQPPQRSETPGQHSPGLGGAPDWPGRPSIGHAYSRMVSNWNLQPIGPSAFTTLKPDMVS